MSAPYQLLPRLTPEEYDALRSDIATHGVRVPIDVDEDGNILDGHHRSWIAAELDVECPQRVVAGLSEQAKRDHALSVNIHRRHLSKEQRRDLLTRSLVADPDLSDRQHAERTGVSDKTVGSLRREMEARAEIPHVATRTDSVGRQQPASKPQAVSPPLRPAPAVEVPPDAEPPPSEEDAAAADGLARHLDDEVRDMRFMQNFTGALSRATDMLAFPPERVGELATPSELDALRHYGRSVESYVSRVSAAGRGLRVLPGGNA